MEDFKGQLVLFFCIFDCISQMEAQQSCCSNVSNLNKGLSHGEAVTLLSQWRVESECVKLSILENIPEAKRVIDINLHCMAIAELSQN